MGAAVCAGLHTLSIKPRGAGHKKAAPKGAAFFGATFFLQAADLLQLARDESEMNASHNQQKQRYRQRHAHGECAHHAFAAALVFQHEIRCRAEAVNNECQKENHNIFHARSVIEAATQRQRERR